MSRRLDSDQIWPTWQKDAHPRVRTRGEKGDCGSVRSAARLVHCSSDHMQQAPRQSKAKFVAIEHGGLWCPYAGPTEGQDLIVLAQQAEESASDFARRFIRKVASANAAGIEVASAELVVAPVFDIWRLAARSAIARTLICSFAPNVERELVIVAPGNTAGCHAHLRALAEVLRDGARANCTIHLRCAVLRPTIDGSANQVVVTRHKPARCAASRAITDQSKSPWPSAIAALS
jgi:hypothetical protein